MIADGAAALIYDDDCGLCARFATSAFVRAARVTPIGAHALERDAARGRALRMLGFDPARATSAMVLVSDARVDVGAAAFNMLLFRRGGAHRFAGRFLSLPIVVHLETLVYRAVAAHRRRLSGWIGAPACALRPPSSLDSPGGFP